MTHSDDNGLILPPKTGPPAMSLFCPYCARIQNRAEILAYCEGLAQETAGAALR